jgi:chromate transporter
VAIIITCFELFKVFLKIGCLGFGGPFALLAIMEKEVVKQRGWVTPEEFAQSTAIGTLTPGPIFFAAAVHIGYKLKGIKGAIITSISSLLPAFLLTIALAFFYIKVQTLPFIIGITKGITAAVVGLLIMMTFRTGKSIIKDSYGVILAVFSFLILELFKLNPVWVIIASGLLGIVIYRSPKTSSVKKEEI